MKGQWPAAETGAISGNTNGGGDYLMVMIIII
jgi:hypothetical protein